MTNMKAHQWESEEIRANLPKFEFTIVARVVISAASRVEAEEQFEPFKRTMHRFIVAETCREIPRPSAE